MYRTEQKIYRKVYLNSHSHISKSDVPRNVKLLSPSAICTSSCWWNKEVVNVFMSGWQRIYQRRANQQRRVQPKKYQKRLHLCYPTQAKKQHLCFFLPSVFSAVNDWNGGKVCITFFSLVFNFERQQYVRFVSSVGKKHSKCWTHILPTNQILCKKTKICKVNEKPRASISNWRCKHKLVGKDFKFSVWSVSFHASLSAIVQTTWVDQLVSLGWKEVKLCFSQQNYCCLWNFPNMISRICFEVCA